MGAVYEAEDRDSPRACRAEGAESRGAESDQAVQGRVPDPRRHHPSAPGSAARTVHGGRVWVFHHGLDRRHDAVGSSRQRGSGGERRARTRAPASLVRARRRRRRHPRHGSPAPGFEARQRARCSRWRPGHRRLRPRGRLFERRHDDGALPVVGTASHMAPEQARGEPATAASDWYAVGTIAVRGAHWTNSHRRRFGGSAASKTPRRSASAFQRRGSWPEDLVELCRGLLSPDPANRPDCARILRFLGTGGASRPIAGAEPAFVGRLRELAALSEALDRAESGSLVVCRVSGSPGIGKTALVREFLRRAARERNAVVLSGRCYEREATPFKLLEGLVDRCPSRSNATCPEHAMPWCRSPRCFSG